MICAHRRTGLWATSLLAILLISCGKDGGSSDGGVDVSGVTGTSRPLELRSVNGDAGSTTGTSAVTQRFYPPAEVKPWAATGMRAFVSPVAATPAEKDLPGYVSTAGESRAPALVVMQDAGKPRSVSLPGPFDPQTFNSVVLRVVVPEEDELTVSFHAGGTEQARSAAVSVAGGETPQLVAIDLAALRGVQGNLDELRVEGAGHSRGLMLLEVALASRPLRDFLPSLGSVPELVDLGGSSFDQRRGVGLFSDDMAEVVFEAQAEEELRFSYGMPRALALSDSKPKLQVTVEGEGGQRIERELPVATIWRRESLSLSELGDGAKRATFELKGREGVLEACAIGELRAGRSGDGATVVLVTSDTHRGDHVGAYSGDAPVRTPVLDGLAARGVFFSDAYAPANTTNPSHTSLMTGLHVRDTRVIDNRSPLVGDARTLAEVFAEAGYHTLAAVSVRHLLGDESGLGQGFARMSGPVGPVRDARETTTQVESWLNELEGEPVFVWLHIFDAHSPYEPPASTDRRYYPGGKDPYDPSRKLDYRGRFLPVYLRGLTDIEFPYAQYRAEVDALDLELKRVLDHPRVQRGVAAVTADHGESFGAHGIYWDHAGLYPDSLHVPLIVAWSGGPRGERCDVPVRQMDLGRTLLNLAGHESLDFQGRDLREHLGEGTGVETRYMIAKDGNSAAILDEGWLLILNLRDHLPTSMVTERKRHTVELYDLNSDPEAGVDVAVAKLPRARSLRDKLISWLGRASREGLASESKVTAEQASRLAGLGYAGDGADDEVRAGSWFDAGCECDACMQYRQ